MKTIEKIRQKIEELYEGEAPAHDQQCEFEDGYFTGIATISKFLDTLEKPEEKDEDVYSVNESMQKFIKEADTDTEQERRFRAYKAFWDAMDYEPEPDKGLDVTDFCKPIDPGIAQCIADHSWEMLGEDEKPASEELTEYASRAGFDYVDDIVLQAEPNHRWNDHDVEFAYRDGIIAGAKWQKEQMMEDIKLAYGKVSMNPFDCSEAFEELIDKLNNYEK